MLKAWNRVWADPGNPGRHAGDGLAPLPPTGQGAPGMAAGATGTMPQQTGA